ncbi:aldo/keto reductase [Thalassotalea aquiviva]|uniref:aldo/keto reductase n=1 Tax=Thalassotalea aquiviva TaxID=3242415 RepID=UPI00352B78BB
MQYRRMGKTGLQLSELGFGSWVNFATGVQFNDAKNLMAAAYDAGINFYDNAEGYEAGKSEELMGNVISKLQWTRDSYVISSKVFWGGDKPTQRGLSRKHVFDACHGALKRFNVDYLDLYYCHRPDIDTPIGETVEAMTDLVRQGKVMYWGTSEWNAQQISEAMGIAQARNLVAPVVEQPEYNMLRRNKVEGEFRPLYEKGLGLTTFSPLASGLLTGKYIDGIPTGSRFSLDDYQWLKDILMDNPDDLDKIRKLDRLARDIGVPLHHLALCWLLTNEQVSSVILGVSKLAQLEDNLAALNSKGALSHEVMAQIENILQNKPAEPQRF